MAKYRVLKRWRNLETKEIYEASTPEKENIVELTVKRAEEVTANLGDGYIERIEEAPAGDELPKGQQTKGEKDKK